MAPLGRRPAGFDAPGAAPSGFSSSVVFACLGIACPPRSGRGKRRTPGVARDPSSPRIRRAGQVWCRTAASERRPPPRARAGGARPPLGSRDGARRPGGPREDLRPGSLSARYSDTSAGRRGHSPSWTRRANSISASPQARWRKPHRRSPTALVPADASCSRCGKGGGSIEHQVLEAGGHRGHPGQGRPVGQDHAAARLAQLGDGGPNSVVGEPPRGDRDPPAAEPGRRRGALDQLAPAKRIRAQRQHRVAAGGQGGHRGHWRAAAPIHDLAAIGRPGDVDDLPRRPIVERRLARGVQPAPPFPVGGIRSLLRLRGEASRIQLPQHHAGLHRPVPLVQLELQGDIDRVVELRRPTARR